MKERQVYLNGRFVPESEAKISIYDSALMFGDSKLDYDVAVFNKIDFVFVHKWSDFKDYNNFCKKNSIKMVSYLSDFLM